MTHTTKNARRNSLCQREQTNNQHKIPSIAAMPSISSGAVILKDVVRQSGRYIHLVVRIRPHLAGGNMMARSLGSGFLAAPYRFITAAHVLDNSEPGADELAKHKDGDMYGFASHDDNDNLQEKFSGTATPVGVLGYPLTQLEFEGGSFNNGNSGGPIIDLETGNVVSWVKGYRKVDVDLKEKDIPNTFTPREYTQKTYIESIQATYSVGIATASVLKELREHDIIS